MITGLRGWVSRVWSAATSGTANPSQWLVDWVRGESSDSGVEVDGVSAMRYAPIWNAVNKIAGHVGQLPLVLHEEISDRERRKAKNHPAYRLLKRRPNSLMTPIVFKELLQHHALLWGNGRAVIVRNGRGDPDELIPLPAYADTDLIDGVKLHWYRDRKTNIPFVFTDDEVFHVPGLGYDGIKGYSLVEMARNSIGLGLASEKHMNRHFRNNAVPSLILEAPTGVLRKEEDARDFLANWERFHKGLDNQQKTGLLREGIKATTLGMPGRDAQWIEQRVFQRQEAALWLLLESILGDDSSVSYNSLEAKNLAYLVNCLMRWLTKWEEEGNRKLLTRRQQDTDSHFFKFTTAALLRASTKERFEVYQIGRQIRVFSANDVRAMEDLPPVDGGDDYDNPATTPGPSPDDDLGGSGDGDQAPDSDSATTAGRRQIAAMLDVEAERIIRAASKAGNFVAWLDSFYEKLTPALIAMYAAIGGTQEDAKCHADLSKEQILVAAGGASTTDGLIACIREVLVTWPCRAEEWNV